MCGDHGPDELDPFVPWPDGAEPPTDEISGWTRRQVLQAGAAVALGGIVLTRSSANGAAP